MTRYSLNRGNSVTCPSSMSLCRPERSCSVLLVRRMDRLWDFLFCFAWRAAALLPLSGMMPVSNLDSTGLKSGGQNCKNNQRSWQKTPVFNSEQNLLNNTGCPHGSGCIWQFCECGCVKMTKGMSVKNSAAERICQTNPQRIP